jgi:hypothetical protein
LSLHDWTTGIMMYMYITTVMMIVIMLMMVPMAAIVAMDMINTEQSSP